MDRVMAAEGRGTPMVLLGDDGDEPQLAAALAMNVAGAFSKNSTLDEFLVGVRAVVSGHRAIGSGLLVRMLERPTAPLGPESQRIASRLSPTEVAIPALIGPAQSMPAIAGKQAVD